MKTLGMVAVLCLAPVLVGCGGKPYKGETRIAISGKVSVDGELVDGGTITFVPTVASDKQRAAGGQIVKGEYKVPEEKGPNAGSYKVLINWPKPTGRKLADSDTGGMIDEVAEAVPPKYNTQSELTADVSATKNVFDFTDLKTK